MSIRLQQRHETTTGRQLAVLLLSLLVGFIAVGLVFAAKGVNPLFALWKILAGSFGSLYGISETITKAIPLILIGSGLTLAFRAKFWNIGAESQLLMGAIFATWIGLNLGPRLPGWLLIPLMFLAGFLGGAFWGILPALFKVRFGVNEVISTLMLNYVAAEFLNLLIVGPWKGATQQGFPYTDDLPASAMLPLIPGTRIHYVTLLVALICALILFVMIYSTKFGYELRVVGENPEAARYAGINFFRTTVVLMIVSGGVAGLAGVGEAAGIHHHLTYPGVISAGYGFTAIIVAWLAKLNPLASIISALFFAGILVGGDAIQISLGLPAATVHVFNGILLFFLIMGDTFVNKRLVVVRTRRV
ncbi:MAG: ABC transporter permease [Spirochaetaceae bacterium]|nr:MAG: ABC transporter permease [Spirochaetaceae bacterium]